MVINGCDSMELLDQAFQVARTFKPLSQAEMTALLAQTRDAALTGKYELFKTTSMFDGTANTPVDGLRLFGPRMDADARG